MNKKEEYDHISKQVKKLLEAYQNRPISWITRIFRWIFVTWWNGEAKFIERLNSFKKSYELQEADSKNFINLHHKLNDIILSASKIRIKIPGFSESIQKIYDIINGKNETDRLLKSNHDSSDPFFLTAVEEIGEYDSLTVTATPVLENQGNVKEDTDDHDGIDPFLVEQETPSKAHDLRYQPIPASANEAVVLVGGGEYMHIPRVFIEREKKNDYLPIKLRTVPEKIYIGDREDNIRDLLDRELLKFTSQEPAATTEEASERFQTYQKNCELLLFKTARSGNTHSGFNIRNDYVS